MRSRRALILILGLICAGAAVVHVVRPVVRAAAFIGRTAGVSGWMGSIASWNAQPAVESTLTIPMRAGATPARLYRPAGRVRRAVILASGIHPAGIQEARLVRLARELAATGLIVVTPELPDLEHYRITPDSVDRLEDAGLWLANQPSLSPDGRVGMMGISFSGGLAIVAAGRPSIRDRVAFVFALGGHGDLPRVLRYLCTGYEPGAPFRKPHDYGLAVILLGVADTLVPAAQAAALREAVQAFLDASALDPIDPVRAKMAFARAHLMEAALPEPAATLMHAVNTRDVGALGPRMLPHLESVGGAPALSPERSTAPSAPVFLLHGTEDNVVPPDETVRLAAYLERTTRVRSLRTGLITHAELDRPSDVREIWRLVTFWADLLSR